MTGQQITINAILITLLGGLVFLVVQKPGFIKPPAPMTEPEVDKRIETEDFGPFELAQKYFNHSGNGVYDLERARYYYTQAIVKATSTNSAELPMSWYQLGRIDFLEGKFDAAEYKFTKLIEMYGEIIPSAHYMLGLVHGYRARDTGAEADWQKAEVEFQTFIAGKPESPWARTDLSWIYFAQGKYEPMILLLEDGLKYEPSNPWLLNMYGLALLNTNQKVRAEAMFQQAKVEVDKLSVAEWGASYPGNDSRTWAEGLNSFKEAVAKNLALSQAE